MKPPPRSDRKMPKARVMFACSKDMAVMETLVAQPKSYGPSLDVPLALIPTRHPAQARALVRFARLSEEEKIERLVTELPKVDKGNNNHGEDCQPDYETARCILIATGLMENDRGAK